jgi:hypothetical protein
LRRTTVITINKWYHVDFVYDYTVSTQFLYLNGILQSNRSATPYLGKTGSIAIGAVKNPVFFCFTGYIERVSLVIRAKTANEVLYDATTVCYYPFDSNTTYDFGPLGINGSAFVLSFAPGTGRVNDNVSFLVE